MILTDTHTPPAWDRGPNSCWRCLNGEITGDMKSEGTNGATTAEIPQARYILGARIDVTNYDQATEVILSWASRAESKCVIEAPINMVMECYDQPDFLECINRAELVTPGGMPIVWSMRLLGVR